MLQHPSISLIDIQGFSEKQLRVEVPNFNLRRYGISLQELANLIGKQDLDLPLG